jgi:hypothetical protein
MLLVKVHARLLGLVASLARGRNKSSRLCTILSEGEPFVVPRSDAASAKMQIFVCEHKVSTTAVQSALSRSALLADMHRNDPEGCALMPCDTETWTAWLADDPSQMSAYTMDLMIAVVKVRFFLSLVTAVHW